MTRPYVLLSVAASADGCIDDATEDRLLLSNDADFARVDAVRAGSDAILVGANTIRKDNPRLLVRSAEHRQARQTSGRPPSPFKVTITATGDLDPVARFFTAGEAAKLVYCPTKAVANTKQRLDGVDNTTVVGADDPLTLTAVLEDLARRGVAKLMVEGGQQILTWFLSDGLVDEIHLAIAPFFVGAADAPRWVGAGPIPWDAHHRMTLAEVRQIGDVVLLRYLTPSVTTDASLAHAHA